VCMTSLEKSSEWLNLIVRSGFYFYVFYDRKVQGFVTGGLLERKQVFLIMTTPFKHRCAVLSVGFKENAAANEPRFAKENRKDGTQL